MEANAKWNMQIRAQDRSKYLMQRTVDSPTYQPINQFFRMVGSVSESWLSEPGVNILGFWIVEEMRGGLIGAASRKPFSGLRAAAFHQPAEKYFLMLAFHTAAHWCLPGESLTCTWQVRRHLPYFHLALVLMDSSYWTKTWNCNSLSIFSNISFTDWFSVPLE